MARQGLCRGVCADLRHLQHLTLTGEMLRRVLQSMCEPIEVLIALTLAVLDLSLQCSPADPALALKSKDAPIRGH